MKAKFIFSILLLFCLSISINANTRETITFSNIEKTETGCVKEFLYCDKDTNAPLAKTIYNYDAEGRLLDKASYDWNGSQGWVGTQKYLYSYGENNQPLTPTLIKWDKKNKCWGETSR